MKNQPRRVLKELIERYGAELATDPRRTEALLNDLCGQYRREIFVLINAQRENVPAELLAAPTWMPRSAVWERLSRRLQDKLALAEDASDWAVESWADALNLTGSPGGVHSRLVRRSAGRQSARYGVESGTEEAPASTQPVAAEAPASRSGARTRQNRRAEPAVQPYLWIAGAVLVALVFWIVIDGAGSLARPARLLAGPQRWFMAVRSDPADHVQGVYALPRTAWVSAGPLFVRSGPSTADDSSAMLEAGAVVTVTAYSRDAQWSQISQPAEGWVSNLYLNFLPPGGVPAPVRISAEAMTAVLAQTPVLDMPDAAGAVAGTLEAGAGVTAIAVTVDGQWRHIVRPMPGWVASANLQSAIE
jgi:hypothetical protein